MHHNSPDDQQFALDALRQRFHEGDSRAFESLARPHLDLLFTLCLRMTRSYADAEDLAQEALIRALEKHRNYNPRRALRPWLMTIATNLCRDRLRTVWWQRVVPFVRQHESTRPTPFEVSAATEQDRRVRRALATLPVRYREAVSLFHLDGINYQEMSVITNTSVAALKQRVRRGNAMLRAALERLYPEDMMGRKK